MDERGTQPGGIQAPFAQQQQAITNRPLHSTAAHNADLPGIERLARLRTVPSQGHVSTAPGHQHFSGPRSASQAMMTAAGGPTQMDIDAPSRSLPAPGGLSHQLGGRLRTSSKSEVSLMGGAEHHPHPHHHPMTSAEVITAGAYALDMRQSMTFSSAGPAGSDLLLGLGSTVVTPTGE
jgi:hypothetical protein